RANLIRFNFLAEREAFTRTETGHYHLNVVRMKTASQELAGRILQLQGDGDLEGVRALEKQYGTLSSTLTSDLSRVEAGGVPVDVIFQHANK
ncbi:MAG: Zn-dependent hydrolase, partial [Magnetococcales bacterium]|nr:Zn-dependent hydrolase [Magnetococcales bacterium]